MTEQEVSHNWSQVFKGSKFESDAFDRAEQLLEELRPESPLRHRLTHELEELRTMQSSRENCRASSGGNVAIQPRPSKTQGVPPTSYFR